MRIYAFQGLRYSADAGATQELLAPLYDQISANEVPGFHQRSEHQFTRLTMPVTGDSSDRYQEADRLHKAWLADGTIARDPQPALYPYVIEPADGTTRRLGVIALAGHEDPEAGIIRPHEHTIDKPLGERFELLKTMRVDLEPIYLLADDSDHTESLEALIAEDIEGNDTVVDYRDDVGHRHLVWRQDNPERIARYRSLLGDCDAPIADGHHRYKASRLLAKNLAVDEAPTAAKLTVIGSLSSPNLLINPIHRAFDRDYDLSALDAFVTDKQTVDAADGEAFAQAVADAPGSALGVTRTGQPAEIWTLDPAHGDDVDSIPAGGRELTVLLLHGVLYPALGLSIENATDGTTLYRSEPNVLWSSVNSGQLRIGLWLPPMEPSAFAAAIADGDVLPPKSTRFLPKVVSGLVWSGHDGEIG